METKAVLFDAAGTLIKPARPVGDSYASLAAKHGICVAPAELFARFRVCFDSASALAFPGANPADIGALERSWWKRLVRKVFEPFGPFNEFDAFFDELFVYFARADSWELYPEAIETLHTLRDKGLQLSVVSNFDSRLIGILEGLGAASWLRAIFVSSVVGYAKPDRRIFDFALAAQQVASTNVVHVGDSITNDVSGARNAGLRGILVDRELSHEQANAPRIGNLREILFHLD